MYYTDPYGLPEIRERIAALAATFAGVAGLESPDRAAQSFYDEHYAWAKSPYTEASNFAVIETEIAERFLNQPALVAARGAPVKLRDDPQVKATIAQGAAEAHARWQATQQDSGNGWGILSGIVSTIANFWSGNYAGAAMSAVRTVQAADQDAPDIPGRAGSSIVGRASQLSAGTKVDPLGTFFRLCHV